VSELKHDERHLPGEEGIWLFIIGDLVMFTALFAIFLYYRTADLQAFRESHRLLNQDLGLANTALMLTSSWCVASAVRAAKLGRVQWVSRLLFGGIVCGIGFGIIKYFEWSAKISAGFSPQSNDFFMFYFTLTGIHLVHVIIGTLVLIFFARFDWSLAAPGGTALRDLESGASFWHLVDLLWVVLFALVYLMP
jgi:nitric oxide reductase NorE protein